MKRSTQPRRTRAETEFRPAVLEILEQPQSPIRAGIIWVICTFAFGAIVWSYFGTFDIVATAQGKLQPQGRVKVIQAVEAGRTVSNPIANGTRVKQGDTLIELDATDAWAELRAIESKLSSVNAAIVRRAAALDVVRIWREGDYYTPDTSALNQIEFEQSVPAPTAERERYLFSSQLEQLEATLRHLSAQRRQQESAQTRYDEMIIAQEALVSTLQQKVSMRDGLAALQAGSRIGLLDATEARQQEEGTLTELKGHRSEAIAALETISNEARKVLATFTADVYREQVEAMELREELQQQQIRARNRLDAMTIKSPIDGTVQVSALTTVGQVLASGVEVMRVVPTDTPLEVEAYLPNRDVGFVTIGQEAVLKIEAFPFTRYGIVSATVTSVALDAIPEPDAQQLEGQPAKSVDSIIPVGNAQRMQNLVFPVTVRPTVSEIFVDGVPVHLTAGMAVTVEIKTGRRRILEYLFSPISEVTSEAMRER